MAAAAILLGYEGRGQTLKGDEWDYAIRLSAQPLGHALFQPPPDKYLLAVPLLLYKGLFEAFGIGSYVPYRVCGIVLVLLCAGLFFALARKRVGDLLAVPPTILLLFFGSASEVVVTPLRIPSLIAIAAGLAMLLAVERRSVGGDLAACVLLIISLASHPESAAFAAAAIVLVLFRPAPQRWRSLWVVVVPLALLAGWYAANGHSGGTNPASDRLTSVPRFIVESFVSVTADISGVSGLIDGSAFHNALGWIAAGLLLAVIAGALAQRRKPLTPRFWALIAGLLVLLVSTALAPVAALRTPDISRYIYPEAILVLLLLTELAGAVRLPRIAAWIAVAVLSAALVANLADLRRAGAYFRSQSDGVKAQLGAVELARSHVGPTFLVFGAQLQALFGPDHAVPTTPLGAGGNGVLMRAGEYFEIARDFGTPAYPPAELAHRPAGTGWLADMTLARALGIRLESVPPRSTSASGQRPRVSDLAEGGARSAGACVHLFPRRGETQAEITLPRGGARLSGLKASDQLSIDRFSPLPAAQLQPPSRHGPAYLPVPTDASPIPWTLSVKSTRPLSVCGFRGA
jgi:hypothetical protein